MVNVVTDQYASPTLNSHLARMLLEVAERRLRGTYHLTGSTRASRYQFAILLARRYGFDENLLIPVGAESVEWMARRPPDSSLDVGKAREMLNNKPITIEESLEQFAREAPHP
jgi:dTDP-4-dehydrorhamnose reductase